MSRVREVTAGHGHEAAMGYQFRARIEARITRRGEQQWRWVGEYRHMAWSDDGPGLPGGARGGWRSSRSEAEAEANTWLDEKARAPAGEYVTA